MISLTKQKQYLQIILEFSDPSTAIRRIMNSASDILWINVLTHTMYEFNKDTNAFDKLSLNLFKDIVFLDYRTFIILCGKDLTITRQNKLTSLSKTPGLNHIVKEILTSNSILKYVPRHITVADSPDKLLVILFLLLIRVPPTSPSQLTANILNSSNVFTTLILDSTINV